MLIMLKRAQKLKVPPVLPRERYAMAVVDDKHRLAAKMTNRRHG